MSKLPVTNRRRLWVANRKEFIFKGETLYYNASQQSKYVSALEKLVSRMTRITNREIEKLFHSPEAKEFFATDATLASQARILTNKLTERFNKLFGEEAKPLSEKMLKGASATSAVALKSSLKKLSGGVTLQTRFMGANLNQILTASVAENVALIKSIPAKYFQQIQNAVMRSIVSGNGLKDLQPALKKYEGMTDRRAKNIALDQTRKAYGALNAGRMRKVGVKEYMWLHSGGGQHPREDHIEMSGLIFTIDPPAEGEEDRRAIIDRKTGERGIPGQAPNCKCTMKPIITFDEGVEQ